MRYAKKKYFIMLTVFTAVIMTFTFCNEEDRYTPFQNDGTNPPVVTDIQVENLSGGAKISYRVPEGKDVLLIEAKYKLDDGTEIFSRSSIFKNFLIIEGLRKIETQSVELTTVDKSGNRSKTTKVDINPTTAPIDLFFNSFRVAKDFGGVELRFDNALGNKYEIQLFVKDTIAVNESGEPLFTHNRSIFTENPEITTTSFRPFESKEAIFKFVVLDKWNHMTDTLSVSVTPRKEIKLNTDLFGRHILPNDGTSLECCGNNFYVDQLWDGKVRGRDIFITNDNKPDPIPVLPPYTKPNQIPFTIDMGQKVNMSRIKIFNTDNSSPGKYFNRGNIKRFDMWGIESLPDDYHGNNFFGWDLLIENGEQIKPSGLGFFKESAEDSAFGAAGIDFKTDPEPTVRYLRFIVLETWEPSSFWVRVGDIEFYGQVVE